MLGWWYFHERIAVTKITIFKSLVKMVYYRAHKILAFCSGYFYIILNFVLQTSVSVKRINTFMNSDELDPDSISQDQDAGILQNHIL